MYSPYRVAFDVPVHFFKYHVRRRNKLRRKHILLVSAQPGDSKTVTRRISQVEHVTIDRRESGLLGRSF